MICPYCGAKAGCVDTRQEVGSRMRRYHCRSCGGGFTTREILTRYDAKRILPESRPIFRLAFVEDKNDQDSF